MLPAGVEVQDSSYKKPLETDQDKAGNRFPLQNSGPIPTPLEQVVVGTGSIR